MQVLIEEPKYYLPLLFPLALFLLSDIPLLDLVLLLCFFWLISSGIYFQNYCNMACSMLFCPFLLMSNFQRATQIIEENSKPQFWEMESDVSSDPQIYLTLLEAVVIILASYFTFKKYWAYRLELSNE